MMRRFAAFIALVAPAAGLLLAGSSVGADGNPCGTSSLYSASASVHAVWRMEVREDESTYRGPSITDRLTYNWTSGAKRNYRWTSTAMPVDAGTSTQLMTISAAVIGIGVPALEKGDIVDVAVVSQEIDYSEGRAPVVVRRVCAARDEGCWDGLRKKQERRVAGVEIGGGYSVAGDRNPFPLVVNVCRSALQSGCRGGVAAVLR